MRAGSGVAVARDVAHVKPRERAGAVRGHFGAVPVVFGVVPTLGDVGDGRTVDEGHLVFAGREIRGSNARARAFARDGLGRRVEKGLDAGGDLDLLDGLAILDARPRHVARVVTEEAIVAGEVVRAVQVVVLG